MEDNSGKKGHGGDTISADNKDKIKSSELLINRAVLVVVSENFFGMSFVIDKKTTLIGRDKKADIFIKDPLVSHNHCILKYDDGNKFYIEDLDSKNSTFLNKKKIKKKTALLYGDRIVVGNTILRFFLEEKI
jgi:pSer/pThr/pTyr-binding forkhead associated (FHA) protein